MASPERLAHLFVAAATVGNFGNARYARSIFEQAYANMASRALADGHDRAVRGRRAPVADLPTDDSVPHGDAPDRFPATLTDRRVLCLRHARMSADEQRLEERTDAFH